MPCLLVMVMLVVRKSLRGRVVGCGVKREVRECIYLEKLCLVEFLQPLVSAAATAIPTRARELTRALACALRRDVGLKIRQATNKRGYMSETYVASV